MSSSADYYLKNGWDKDYFILGTATHDTGKILPTEPQISTLSQILNIPKADLLSEKEFIKAKFAEPMKAKHNMLFFTNALNIKEIFKNKNYWLPNYIIKIPENYEDGYFKALENGEGFNPMDALEKQFKAQGLDKTESKLYKKIIKYRNILSGKEEKTPLGLIAISTGIASLLLYFEYRYLHNKNRHNS